MNSTGSAQRWRGSRLPPNSVRDHSAAYEHRRHHEEMDGYALLDDGGRAVVRDYAIGSGKGTEDEGNDMHVDDATLKGGFHR